jgi:hypothetical protein
VEIAYKVLILDSTWMLAFFLIISEFNRHYSFISDVIPAQSLEGARRGECAYMYISVCVCAEHS